MINDEILLDLKILYVEDETVMRDVLSNFLRRRCKHVITANDGLEGFDIFKKESPDIVVTDINMPNLNGLDMVAKIREIAPTIPIIITTGYNDEEYYQRAIDLNIDRYIKKPFSLKEFITILSATAKSVQQEKEIYNQSVLIHEVLDLNQNFMLITDGKEISYVNRPLLRFCHVKNLSEFKVNYNYLTNLLADFDGAFYKDKSFTEWIAIAKKESKSNKNKLIIHIKKPKSDDQNIFSYLLTVNAFPASKEMVLSFSDITNIEKEKLYYQEMAQYDELTGIYNRKKFNEELNKNIDIVNRYNSKLSMVIFDIDHFKIINDKYGHLIGDYVLKEIVKVVNSSIRRTDIFSRYGGEEFTLLMPYTNLKDCSDTAERIRKSITNHKFVDVGKVTCSFGLTEFIKDKDTALSLIDRTDKALYLAKNSGRNKVEIL